jgi:hypothetical protein
MPNIDLGKSRAVILNSNRRNRALKLAELDVRRSDCFTDEGFYLYMIHS